MTVITSQLLSEVLTNVRALFRQSFEAAMMNQGWMTFTTKISNAKQVEKLSWLGTDPTMQQFDGQLQTGGLNNFSYTMTNLLYKGGFEVERMALERDALSQIAPRAAHMGREAAAFAGRQVNALFEAPGNAFNSTAFFSDSHTIGDASIDNEHEVTSAAAVPTAAELRTYLAAVRNKMRKFRDDKNRVMGLVPDTLVIPGEIESAMRQALTGWDIGGQQGGVAAPSINGVEQIAGYNLIVNPYLTDVNDWYALHTRGEVKPFILTEEVAPTVESVTDPGSELLVVHEKVIYAARTSIATGVGHPAHAVKVVDAGS